MVRMARISTSIGLSRVKHVATHVTNLSCLMNNSRDADPQVVNALNNCIDILNGTANELEGSIYILSGKKEEERNKYDELGFIVYELDLNMARASSYHRSCLINGYIWVGQ